MNIKAPPVDGKANAAIINFFVGILDISKLDITLEKGSKNKHKLLSVDIDTTEENVFETFKGNMI